MDDNVDYYSILGVKRKATGEEIKRAYRKLLFRYHPDRNPKDEEAAHKLKQVLEAYDVLSDHENKQRYDHASRGNFPEEISEEPGQTHSSEGHEFSYEFKQKQQPEPKCPQCFAVGIDLIVSRKGGSGTSRGKQFIHSPFSVVFCNQCGHVYGITSAAG